MSTYSALLDSLAIINDPSASEEDKKRNSDHIGIVLSSRSEELEGEDLAELIAAATYIKETITPVSLRNRLKVERKSARRRGFYHKGDMINSSESSVAALQALYSSYTLLGYTAPCEYKVNDFGKYITLEDGAAILDLLAKMDTHVSKCFAAEKLISDEIEAQEDLTSFQWTYQVDDGAPEGFDVSTYWETGKGTTTT